MLSEQLGQRDLEYQKVMRFWSILFPGDADLL
jgi:hypothetical protein